MARYRRHRQALRYLRHPSRPKRSQVKQGLKLGGKKLANFAIGGALLAGARRLPDFAGPYQGAVDKIIVGGGASLAGIGGHRDLLTAGLKEAIADVIDIELLPRVGGLFGGILGGAKAANGGRARLVSN